MRSSNKLSPAVLGALFVLAGPLQAAETAATPVQLAQIFNRPQPPADLDDDDKPPQRAGQDSGELVVRITRLENQIRSLTGQIEQLQFQIRKLEEQARTQAPSIAGPVAAPAPLGGAPVVISPAQPSGAAIDPTRRRRSDAFDPAADPTAPGAPRQLGTTPPSAPIANTPTGPLAARPATGGAPAVIGAPAAPGGLQPMDLGGPRPPAAPAQIAPAPGLPNATPGVAAIAAAQPPGAKEEYEMASGYLKQGQYDAAEKGFSTFLQKNPKNRLVSDAIFGLGESYFQRSRHREAAEQYLKITTNYANSARGAEALLRLGESLNALGAKEQACASFGEIARKYPGASTTIRAADRESKKIQC